MTFQSCRILEYNTSPKQQRSAIHAADKGMTFLAGRFGEVRALGKTPLWMVSCLFAPTRLCIFANSEGLLPTTHIACGVAGFVMAFQEDRSMLTLIRV